MENPLPKYNPKFRASYKQRSSFSLFGKHIRTESLAMVCRVLGTMLGSGVGIKKSLKIASKKTGDPRCEQAMHAIYDAVDRGEEIATSMKEQGDAFPPLMIDMIQVAEQTGTLPEVLRRLALHYDNMIRMRRNFLRQIRLPVVQLVAAILVI